MVILRKQNLFIPYEAKYWNSLWNKVFDKCCVLRVGHGNAGYRVGVLGISVFTRAHFRVLRERLLIGC